MTEQELVNKILSTKEEIKRLTEETNNAVSSYISEYCPYKLGQIVDVTRKTIKNTGGIFTPNYEVTKETKLKGVLSNIRINTIYHSTDNVEFIYSFKQLKKDGRISGNSINKYNSEFVWTDEIYDFKTGEIKKL